MPKGGHSSRNEGIQADSVTAEVLAVGKGATASRTTRSEETAGSSRPVRVLFLASNPIDQTPLRLSEEVRTIDERLREGELRERFQLEQQWALRLSDLSQAMLRHAPHVVHFSGHGTSKDGLIFEDDRGGSAAASIAAGAELFRILRDEIRCVVLNACHTQPQAEAIAEHIDCVVGTSLAIGDEAAIRFAGGFYRGIGFGRSIETAFDLGVNEIDLAGLGEAQTPRLRTRAGVDASGVRF